MNGVLPVLVPLALLWGLSILASIGDVALTLRILRDGRQTEAIPITRWVMKLAPWLAYASSLGLTVLWCAAVWPWRESITAKGWVAAAVLFRLFCIALNYQRVSRHL